MTLRRQVAVGVVAVLTFPAVMVAYTGWYAVRLGPGTEWALRGPSWPAAVAVLIGAAGLGWLVEVAVSDVW